MNERDKKDIEKLIKLTKMIQGDKIKIEPKGSLRGPNKWRTSEPKFDAQKEKPTKSENTVQAGGMEVDASLKDDYENWRKDKMAEQAHFREQALRRAKAKHDAKRRAQNPPQI